MTVKDWLILFFVGLPLGLVLWAFAIGTLVALWHFYLDGRDDHE